jgi:putative transposase
MLRARERFLGPVWQKRFYDFNVCSAKKRVEKLRYLHRNPVTRGLVSTPEDWEWSSYRAYAHDKQGLLYVETSPSQVNVHRSHSFQPME